MSANRHEHWQDLWRQHAPSQLSWHQEHADRSLALITASLDDLDARQVGATRLSDRSVALVVKRAVLGAGLDPSRYAGHSLRSGMATSAARNGVSEADIARQTGHRSMVVLRRYIRAGSLFDQNAAARLGL